LVRLELSCPLGARPLFKFDALALAQRIDILVDHAVDVYEEIVGSESSDAGLSSEQQKDLQNKNCD
jgi:hypothetical protein